MGSIPRSSAALLQRSRVGRKRGFVQILLSLTLAHPHSSLAPRPEMRDCNDIIASILSAGDKTANKDDGYVQRTKPNLHREFLPVGYLGRLISGLGGQCSPKSTPGLNLKVAPTGQNV